MADTMPIIARGDQPSLVDRAVGAAGREDGVDIAAFGVFALKRCYKLGFVRSWDSSCVWGFEMRWRV